MESVYVVLLKSWDTEDDSLSAILGIFTTEEAAKETATFATKIFSAVADELTSIFKGDVSMEDAQKFLDTYDPNTLFNLKDIEVRRFDLNTVYKEILPIIEPVE